jgi:hypothetical protein
VLCDGVRGCDAFNFAPSPHVSSNLGGCCLRACPAKTSDGPPHSQPGISYYYHHPYLKTDDINADDSGRVNREYLHSDAAVSAAAVQTLTVYHIGPRNVSRATVPINMDSGSLRAEMYWDLGWKVEAVECANASAAPHLYASDCLRSGNNYLESQNSSNLAITQLDIETNGRYAPFASCVPDEFGRNYACARNGSAVGTMNLTAVTVQATMGG